MKKFTRHNDDGTTTCGNGTIEVTLLTNEFEHIGRYGVFNHAMRILGNRSEAQIMRAEEIDNSEVDLILLDTLIYDNLKANCRYNAGEVLTRYRGGHTMSAGMQSDLLAARSAALIKITENDNEVITLRQEIINLIERSQRSEIDRRSTIGRGCNGWKIKIIGQMPEQIGLCRYRQ